MSAGARVRPGGPGRPLPTGPAAPAARLGQARAGGGRECEAGLRGRARRGRAGGAGPVVYSAAASAPQHPRLCFTEAPCPPRLSGPRQEDHLTGALPSVVSRWPRCAEGDSGARCLKGGGSNVRMCPVAPTRVAFAQWSQWSSWGSAPRLEK